MSPTIMIVNPNTTVAMTQSVVAAARPVARATTTLIGSTSARGVDSIESNVDEVWGALGVLEQVREGERLGVDGYVIACFGDTGLAAARESARGPVVGMTEAALYTAALVATRFAIVTLPSRTLEQSRRVLRETGLTHRASVSAIDVDVSDVHGGSAHLLDAVTVAARAAIEHDAAEALVLGCAGLADLVVPLHERLVLPVIDGVAAAVGLVESLLAQGLRTSRIGNYALPPRTGPQL